VSGAWAEDQVGHQRKYNSLYQSNSTLFLYLICTANFFL